MDIFLISQMTEWVTTKTWMVQAFSITMTPNNLRSKKSARTTCHEFRPKHVSHIKLSAEILFWKCVLRSTKIKVLEPNHQRIWFTLSSKDLVYRKWNFKESDKKSKSFLYRSLGARNPPGNIQLSRSLCNDQFERLRWLCIKSCDLFLRLFLSGSRRSWTKGRGGPAPPWRLRRPACRSSTSREYQIWSTRTRKQN